MSVKKLSNRRYLAFTLVILFFTACVNRPRATFVTSEPVAPLQRAAKNLSTTTPDTAPTVAAKPLLPAPVLVTVAPGAFETVLDDAAARQQFTATGGDDIDAGELNDLMDRIDQGDVVFSSPAGKAAGIQTAYEYRDMDGDGVDDLVLIIVADQSGNVKLSAGGNVDGSAIQLAPIKPGDSSSVQALSIELEELVEVVNRGDGRQTIILRVAGDQVQILSGLE